MPVFIELAEQLSQMGLLGLFLTALLAATLLPFGSEAVFVSLLVNGFGYANVIIVASIGNVLGSVINYGIGLWASDAVAHKWLRMTDADLQKARHRFDKYGLVALCFAWVPIIGDPITVVAGMLRIRFGWFVVLVALGKTTRYAVLAYLTYVAA
ncbi:YqaA family protein [Alteromonas facilis]|uniref:YqaA family protein n=1 Tax=Alteromonas facilis TaxID=2048004 RepID=UPI000C28FEB8|nr:YqaA family protein [Alteromonas facilis]